MTISITAAVSKVLTPNDVGTTGSHQAGIAVPRQAATLAFFPALDTGLYNPRQQLLFREVGGIDEWPLNFIYYNGKLHGRSTRNEYRLTGLTPYFRRHEAAVGDTLHLCRTLSGRWTIDIDHASDEALPNIASISRPLGATQEQPHLYETIKLSGTWSAVSRRKS